MEPLGVLPHFRSIVVRLHIVIQKKSKIKTRLHSPETHGAEKEISYSWRIKSSKAAEKKLKTPLT
jgi:hypothetical protein